MEMVQVNARLDAAIKREGDATLAGLGSSATEAIRALWDFLARAKRLPDYMEQGQDTPPVDQTPQELFPATTGVAEQGAGLALRMARARGLSTGGIQAMSYQELRDAAFEELIEEGRAHA